MRAVASSPTELAVTCQELEPCAAPLEPEDVSGALASHRHAGVVLREAQLVPADAPAEHHLLRSGEYSLLLNP